MSLALHAYFKRRDPKSLDLLQKILGSTIGAPSAKLSKFNANLKKGLESDPNED